MKGEREQSHTSGDMRQCVHTAFYWFYIHMCKCCSSWWEEGEEQEARRENKKLIYQSHAPFAPNNNKMCVTHSKQYKNYAVIKRKITEHTHTHAYTNTWTVVCVCLAHSRILIRLTCNSNGKWSSESVVAAQKCAISNSSWIERKTKKEEETRQHTKDSHKLQVPFRKETKKRAKEQEWNVRGSDASQWERKQESVRESAMMTADLCACVWVCVGESFKRRQREREREKEPMLMSRWWR